MNAISPARVGNGYAVSIQPYSVKSQFCFPPGSIPWGIHSHIHEYSTVKCTVTETFDRRASMWTGSYHGPGTVTTSWIQRTVSTYVHT